MTGAQFEIRIDARVRVLRELGSDKFEIIRFNNSNRSSEVSYVAPLSEDIDLK
jgi:hypothetical protein